jgi:dihydrofolate synthase/folylpolyglutamate synthase
MRFTTLDGWLRWQESLHPRAIELGLDRARAVAARMGWAEPRFAVLTVGGTNGKGSTVAFLEAVLEAGAYRTGAYTSPHLLRYNERVRLRGEAVGDEALCRAFERVDQARGEVSLTYFEFGTLAAMDIFQGSGLDAVMLEVGLGGRLDAVNLFDPDVAVITTVDLDHIDWLGPDRETIGWEKAGILRPGRPAVYGDGDPPASVLEVARTIGAKLRVAGRDYRSTAGPARWGWQCGERALEGLPLPRLAGRFQVQNAAAALTALDALAERLPLTRAAVEHGLRHAGLPGRLQVLPGPVERILDVAHNPQAVRELVRFLRERPGAGRTHALFAMLDDKDIDGVVRAAAPVVDRWHVAGLPPPRGAPVEVIEQRLAGAGVSAAITRYADVEQAYRTLLATVTAPDRIVVFGSFHTVAPALRVESSRATLETLGHG